MIIVLLAIFGLIFGSFVNALVWRFHEQDVIRDKKQRIRSKKGKAGKQKELALDVKLQALSMTRGRSMCSDCHHELAAKDLVPLFSWLWLRGKCRYCDVKIQDNPMVEIMTAALFALSYLWWPLPLSGIGLFQFVVWLSFVVAFIALAVYDLRWFTLPNRIVFPLIGLAAAEVVIVAITKQDWRFALDASVGSLLLSGLFYVLFQISDGTWIGGGDVKLAIVLGLLAGTALKSLLLLFLSSVIGTLFSIPLLLKGRNGMKAKVPFGPFLLAATFVVVLFGTRIVDWYTSLLS